MSSLPGLLTNVYCVAVSRIGLVKPEKARAIEDMIIAAARRGALQEKVSEERLIELLEQVNEQAGPRKTTVTIQRRRMAFDSDEDDDF
jgi:programmed cell death protein 5